MTRQVTRVRQTLWFRPVTVLGALVGLVALVYLARVGVSNRTAVRAVAGSWLLLVVAFTLAIRGYYSEANKRARDPDRGALPKHVRRISGSYILALVYIVTDLWLRAGQPLTWRIPVAVLVGIEGIRGLVELIDFERRRVYVVSPYVTDLRGSPHEERRG